MPKKHTCASCGAKDLTKDFIDPCDSCEDWVCTSCSERIWCGMSYDDLDVCKSCAHKFDRDQILNDSSLSPLSSLGSKSSASSESSDSDKSSNHIIHSISSESSESSESPEHPKDRKDPLVGIDSLAEWGMDAWKDIECAWVKEKKTKWALVTKEIIKEKLLKGETFTYYWFIHEGYAGEGNLLELAVPPEDTGITVSCQYKSQMGDSPKKSRRWQDFTDSLDLLHDGFMAFVAKIMHPSRKVRKPKDTTERNRDASPKRGKSPPTGEPVAEPPSPVEETSESFHMKVRYKQAKLSYRVKDKTNRWWEVRVASDLEKWKPNALEDIWSNGVWECECGNNPEIPGTNCEHIDHAADW